MQKGGTRLALPLMLMLIVASCFFLPVPKAHASTPPMVNYAAAATIGGGASQTLKVRVVAGDVIVVDTQVGKSGSNETPSIGVFGVMDNNSNSYALVAKQGFYLGGNCGSFCSDAEIWSALSKTTGHASVQVTWTSAGSGNSPSMELYDVSGINPTADHTANGSCATGSGECYALTTGATSSSNTFDPTYSFETGSIATDTFSWFNFVAGASYTGGISLANAVGGSQYSVTANSPTSYPFSVSVGTVGDWAEAGAEWGNPAITTVILVVPCTAFELQCWLYPLFVFGLYMTLVLAVVKFSRVPNQDVTGHLLEAFALASLLCVIFGILNVMVPLLVSVFQVVRAIRH